MGGWCLQRRGGAIEASAAAAGWREFLIVTRWSASYMAHFAVTRPLQHSGEITLLDGIHLSADSRQDNTPCADAVFSRAKADLDVPICSDPLRDEALTHV